MGEQALLLRFIRFFKEKAFAFALQQRAYAACGKHAANRREKQRDDKAQAKIAKKTQGENADGEERKKYVRKKS